MCFSVNVNLVKDELENRYGVDFPDRDRYEPSYYYHAFGLPELPAICSDASGQIQLLTWGLIPSWTKNADEANKIRYKTFNARAESIETKPSFSTSFKSRRCIIPVKGFYEWQHKGNVKIPWYIYHPENEFLSFAGIYDSWVETATGKLYNTFSIITTDANDLMAVIHNSKKRMPAILNRVDEKRWIDSDTKPSDAIDLLKPCSTEMLKAYTISNLINSKSANKNTPQIIRPYNREKDSLLF